MPRISSEKLALRRIKVEDGALSLFRDKGFHGVGLRDIAKAAGVSLGNIYNHFDGKEAVFAGLVERLYREFIAESEPLARYIAKANFPDDMFDLGRAMGEMFQRHSDYMTLVYIDVAEFGGAHVRPHYTDLATRFRAVLPPAKNDAVVDPGVGITLVYMQYANYFFVERLVGAKGHLGLSDEEAVQTIARVFLFGLAANVEGRAQEKL